MDREGASGAFLSLRVPQVAPAAPEAEKVVRFLFRCVGMGLVLARRLTGPSLGMQFMDK